MKINGLIDNPLWYGIACKCDHSSVETEFPIASCLHCEFQQKEDSMPRKDFVIKEPEMKNHKPTGKTIERKVKEINIIRGQVYEEILGWGY